jgi:hypothetical protein
MITRLAALLDRPGDARGALRGRMRERWQVLDHETDHARLWTLLEWCVAHGADEFTVEVMALVDVPAVLADAFEDALEPWTRPAAVRAVLDDVAGPAFPARVRLWSLDPHTLALLRRFLPGGPLRLAQGQPGEAGWLEHLVVYRGGELLFGALTHEGAGVLELEPAEREQVAALGLPLHGPMGGAARRG